MTSSTGWLRSAKIDVPSPIVDKYLIIIVNNYTIYKKGETAVTIDVITFSK